MGNMENIKIINAQQKKKFTRIKREKYLRCNAQKIRKTLRLHK
jgi:ribosomal protein L32E